MTDDRMADICHLPSAISVFHGPHSHQNPFW